MPLMSSLTSAMSCAEDGLTRSKEIVYADPATVSLITLMTRSPVSRFHTAVVASSEDDPPTMARVSVDAGPAMGRAVLPTLPLRPETVTLWLRNATSGTEVENWTVSLLVSHGYAEACAMVASVISVARVTPSGSASPGSSADTLPATCAERSMPAVLIRSVSMSWRMMLVVMHSFSAMRLARMHGRTGATVHAGLRSWNVNV
mmetsp:Transcript_41591/g.98633  ORF Transcript_41591/g.98633 Transcript_41591/m.98633 type:complete len:203 (+) Transcript_41591:6829-7437(+)